MYAASAKADQLAIADLLARFGAKRFAAAWLSHRGLSWAAELVAQPEPQAHLETVR